jgi:segregation and condensation protein A
VTTEPPTTGSRGYSIRLPNFEGPLDLLMFLIQKEEIEITDIPIALITKQYLEYVELMRELDLEVAGEFILMAATLIQIKVRMLLPRPETMEGEEAEEDPRAELVRQLLEYKKYKEVADHLMEMEDQQRRFFPRTRFEWEKKFADDEQDLTEIALKDVTLFDLLTAFKGVLDAMPKKTVHEVGLSGPSIEDQISYVTRMVGEKKRIMFRELVAPFLNRVVLIVTFMAMLELIRTHRIVIQQADLFGDIWIFDL